VKIHSNLHVSQFDFFSFIRFVEMWWLLISSTLELPWSEYLNQNYKYQSLQNHICLKLPVFVVICIVNIVQHSHSYNSFLLISVACIVILLVAILYRDHVGFCVIVTFSSIWKILHFYSSLSLNPSKSAFFHALTVSLLPKNHMLFIVSKQCACSRRVREYSYSTRVQKYLLFSPHNLHILTLESGTVEINLAILGIDFVYYVYI
jgi:hypothetical protein